MELLGTVRDRFVGNYVAYELKASHVNTGPLSGVVDRDADQKAISLRQDAGAKLAPLEKVYHANFLSGLAIEPSHVLQGAILNAKHRGQKKLPQWTWMGGYTLVSSNVRAAIESVEPGIHQFFLFKLTFKDGTPGPTYFVPNICTVLDCVEPLLSKLDEHYDERGTRYFTPGIKTKMVVRREPISGHHLWRDSMFRNVFLSNQLASLLSPLIEPYRYCEPVAEV